MHTTAGEISMPTAIKTRRCSCNLFVSSVVHQVARTMKLCSPFFRFVCEAMKSASVLAQATTVAGVGCFCMHAATR